VQTLTRTQNQVTNLSVPEERGFLLERTAAPHTCSGPPQSSAEQFGVETPIGLNFLLMSAGYN